MIYICIPTHNEQQTVGVVLWKLRQVLTEFPRDYQLLVADDASTDKTADVLEPYTRVLPLTVIRTEQRQGAAASLEMLMREAVRRSEYPRRDVIVTLQADFSEEPDDIVPFIKRLEAGADVAVGNKVSATKEPRSRRMARSLAGFFMRGQKWPEGVATPFDGYRAYRLHAVKRAIEDRAGRRLIRFDSWAGNAELLRAVLPHARRVDVVSVEDRPDRLQRPRREKPFASALKVRSLASPAEPPGLVSVEELDRVASTASTSRPWSLPVQSGPRTQASNGAGRRDRRQGGSSQGADGRQTRARTNGAGSAAAGERREPRKRTTGEDTAGRQKRSEPRQGAAAAGPTGRTRGGQQAARKDAQAAGKRDDRSRKPQAPEVPASGDDILPLTPAAEAAGGLAAPDQAPALIDAAAVPGAPDQEAPRPKRKRRRRKRGGKGSAAAGSPAENGTDAAADQPDGAVSDGLADVAADGSTEAAPGGEKKRRRRGGRRGGRGRRRPTAAGPDAAGSAGEDGTAGAESVVAHVPDLPGGADTD